MKLLIFSALFVVLTLSSSYADSFKVSGKGFVDRETGDAIILACTDQNPMNAPCARMQFLEFLASDPTHAIPLGDSFVSKSGGDLPTLIQNYAHDAYQANRGGGDSKTGFLLMVGGVAVGGTLAFVTGGTVFLWGTALWEVIAYKIGYSPLDFTPSFKNVFSGKLTDAVFDQRGWNWISHAKKTSHENYLKFMDLVAGHPSTPDGAGRVWEINL